MQITRNLRLATTFKWLLTAGVVSTLAACGGSSSNGVTISGNAATGAAINGATVTVVCKNGVGSAVTDATGGYSVSIAAPGQGPCVLSVPVTGGGTLRAIAAGNGSKANITPLSELLVSYLATQADATTGGSGTPAALIANPKVLAGLTTTLSTASNLNAAVQTVVNVLHTNGVDVPTDFLTGTLVPGSASNSIDLALESFKTAKASNPDLLTTVVAAVKTEAEKTPVGVTGATGVQ